MNRGKKVSKLQLGLLWVSMDKTELLFEWS